MAAPKKTIRKVAKRATKKATKTTPPKTGRTPPKVLRDQAKLRRDAVRDGLPKHEAELSEFAERFCHEFVRCGVLDEAHRATEVALRQPLDTSGFDVRIEETEYKVKGKIVYSKVMIITDAHGRQISEADLRMGAAANLYALPEVKHRIREIRAERASMIKVSAESVAAKLEQIHDRAMMLGQLQVAANCAAMEAKMFGIEAGPGEGSGAPPAAAVNINIRDYTGKPKPAEG